VADKSKINWTDSTWNPLVGCSIVSPACTNCYAMAMADRIQRMTPKSYYVGTTKVVNSNPVWTGIVKQAPERTLLQPLRWKKPRKIFVNSMSDLFHESVPDEWIDRIFAVMALAPQHTFQCLTKRAARMREYCSADGVTNRIGMEMHKIAPYDRSALNWPLSNAWLGVTAEDQERADERIPDLLATPAAVRFVSFEPLLGAIDVYQALGLRWNMFDKKWHPHSAAMIDLAICGGESGPDARPMHPDWARRLRDQCKSAGTAFWFKQWGEWAPHKPQAGGDLGGDMRAGRVRQIRAQGEPDGHFRKGDCYVARIGKTRAGDLLDGVRHQEFPPSPSPMEAGR